VFCLLRWKCVVLLGSEQEHLQDLGVREEDGFQKFVSLPAISCS